MTKSLLALLLSAILSLSACGSTALVEPNSDASSQTSSSSSHSETTNLGIGSQEQQSDVVSDTSAFSLDDLPA